MGVTNLELCYDGSYNWYYYVPLIICNAMKKYNTEEQISKANLHAKTSAKMMKQLTLNDRYS